MTLQSDKSCACCMFCSYLCKYCFSIAQGSWHSCGDGAHSHQYNTDLGLWKPWTSVLLHHPTQVQVLRGFVQGDWWRGHHSVQRGRPQPVLGLRVPGGGGEQHRAWATQREHRGQNSWAGTQYGAKAGQGSHAEHHHSCHPLGRARGGERADHGLQGVLHHGLHSARQPLGEADCTGVKLRHHPGPHPEQDLLHQGSGLHVSWRRASFSRPSNHRQDRRWVFFPSTARFHHWAEFNKSSSSTVKLWVSPAFLKLHF